MRLRLRLDDLPIGGDPAPAARRVGDTLRCGHRRANGRYCDGLLAFVVELPRDLVGVPEGPELLWTTPQQFVAFPVGVHRDAKTGAWGRSRHASAKVAAGHRPSNRRAVGVTGRQKMAVPDFRDGPAPAECPDCGKVSRVEELTIPWPPVDRGAEAEGGGQQRLTLRRRRATMPPNEM